VRQRLAKTVIIKEQSSVRVVSYMCFKAGGRISTLAEGISTEMSAEEEMPAVFSEADWECEGVVEAMP
jgi:hypothetical protein